MLEWQDVIPYVASKLGQDAQHIPAILKFLHVLPEEVTEGRKINLSVCSTDTSPTLEAHWREAVHQNSCLMSFGVV